MLRTLPLPVLALLAACTATTTPPPAPIGPPIPQPLATGLDRVLGKDARTLQLLFGAPNLDVREGPARKLQYASAVCVLDAYLYPPREGREPLVRHIDARAPGGDDFDKASCVAALSRRREAR